MTTESQETQDRKAAEEYFTGNERWISRCEKKQEITRAVLFGIDLARKEAEGIVKALEICRDVLLLGMGPWSDHKAGVMAQEVLDQYRRAREER